MNKQKDLPVRQAGIIHLVLPLLLLLAAGFVALFYFGIIKNPFKNLPFLGQKMPKVELKTEYKNPFKKETQYVNPFETYKNPFNVAK